MQYNNRLVQKNDLLIELIIKGNVEIYMDVSNHWNIFKELLR